MPELSPALGAFAPARAWAARTPRDWQLEAMASLASGTQPRTQPPLELALPVAAARAEALQAVRAACAETLVRACKLAQQARRGLAGPAANRYGTATSVEIRAHVPVEALPWLCLGPRRSFLTALREACALRPNELQQARKGWRALGLEPGQPAEFWRNA